MSNLIEFIEHSFHDDPIYGFDLISPEPDLDDWRSELVLDIDHIVDWLKSESGSFRFLLSPAKLRFENVSDLAVRFACPNHSIIPVPIDQITRSDAPVVEREPEYREYQWTIALNDMADGCISFRSSGYRLELVGEPQPYEQQTIPRHLRDQMLQS